ncbi:protein FAM107A [Patagioenas fasciata monilis]|uniref:Actin-associated protein FAM107A n=1 Tax=Patagioenas fasciata monilis TaxID=372326 RepID=A0A1V4K985_PATFA|nr:protein FAM107A [Patagioenas fasciata monilis]
MSWGAGQHLPPGLPRATLRKSASMYTEIQRERPDSGNILTHPDYTDGNPDLIKPKKLLNPVKASKSHQELHRELLMNHKRGLGVESKPELQRVLEHRRRNQLIRQKKEEEEAKKLQSPFEKELLKRHQRLDQLEKEQEKQEDHAPEFIKVKKNLRRTSTHQLLCVPQHFTRTGSRDKKQGQSMNKTELVTVAGFAMLLLFQPSHAEVCPPPCRCRSLGESKGLHIDCSSRQLREVPALPLHTRRLYLHNNSLSWVAPGALDGLRSLEELQIWDTAGQERFRTITQSYYRSANGAILAYDISKRGSFLSIPRWIEDVRKYAGSNIVQILIGNKSDLSDLREVQLEEAQSLAEHYDNIICAIETSAKDSSNVEEAFVKMATELMMRHGGPMFSEKNTDSIKLDSKDVVESWGCGC